MPEFLKVVCNSCSSSSDALKELLYDHSRLRRVPQGNLFGTPECCKIVCLVSYEQILVMNEVQTSSVTGERSAERSDSFIDDDADFVKLFVGQARSPKDLDFRTFPTVMNHLFIFMN